MPNQSNPDSNVRSKILSTIEETDDKVLRDVLLLMFGVLENQEAGFRRIENQLRVILKDEQKILRRHVLNGYEAEHHTHHDFIADRIKRGGYCPWAAKKQQEELTVENNNKSFWRKVYEGAGSKLGEAIVIASAIVLGVSCIR